MIIVSITSEPIRNTC